MAKYQMEDNSIVNTEKALSSWKEDTRWDGRNHISVNTGSQWNHETLYLSRKERYYIVHESAWQGSLPHASFIDDEDAAHWLLANGHELPEALMEFEEKITE